MGLLGLEDPSRVSAGGIGVEAGPAARALPRTWLLNETGIVVSLAALVCLVHFLCIGRYGYFRDELYYATCGEHLAWGYVDQAPLIAVIARFTRWLLGDSLFALRFFPALSAGVKVLLAGWMARELVGGRFARSLAATTVLFAPVYLSFDSFFSMNAFEPVFWMLCAAMTMRIAGEGNERLWLLFGVVAGLGSLNKHSMLFFGSGILVGLFLTPQRPFLRETWIWLGGLVAFAIVLPNILWEARYDWPTFQILRTVAHTKNAPVSPLQFILQQALLVHPLTAPVWLGGLYFFLRRREGKAYRFLGWAYLVVLAEMLVLKGKIYYLAPAYPMLLAAGAVWIEQQIRVHNWDWMKPAILAPLVVGGIIAAPLAMPLLPVEAMAKYSQFWDVEKVEVEYHERAKLPQLYADMFGWPEQVALLARVYHSLPPEEQAKCTLFASNYGQAGAIDYFGPALGLPKAISNHNNYFLWGPRNYTGEVVIAIGFQLEELRPLFRQINLAATPFHSYAMPDENNLPIYICRQPKISLQKAWPSLKAYK